MGYIIANAIVSALVALLGRNRTLGYGWSFVLCFFISPIIGLIIILCTKKKDRIYRRTRYKQKRT